ncbi:hypothetical protein INR49_008734 [Caranx melampygus]|nr:hypothetical protein INR49_008734 [Caranx melampygus]
MLPTSSRGGSPHSPWPSRTWCSGTPLAHSRPPAQLPISSNHGLRWLSTANRGLQRTRATVRTGTQTSLQWLLPPHQRQVRRLKLPAPMAAEALHSRLMSPPLLPGGGQRCCCSRAPDHQLSSQTTTSASCHRLLKEAVLRHDRRWMSGMTMRCYQAGSRSSWHRLQLTSLEQLSTTSRQISQTNPGLKKKCLECVCTQGLGAGLPSELCWCLKM